MQTLIAVLMLVIVLPNGAQTSAPAPTYQSTQPIKTPVIFGEGIISTGDYESHPAFEPDGRTLYFVKSTPTFSFWTIVVSRFVDGRWTTPEVAPFSGRYSDADPFITADGKKFYFISYRPIPGKTTRDLDIWVMDKTENGWNEPRNLGKPVNSDANEWYPTLATDGTLYFGSGRAGGSGATDIYRSRFSSGNYAEPENLGSAINTEFDEYEPLIAPDQSYLIFMAAGRPDSNSRSGDLFLSYRKDGTWTKATNLGNQLPSRGVFTNAFSGWKVLLLRERAWPKSTGKTNELRRTTRLAARHSQRLG